MAERADQEATSLWNNALIAQKDTAGNADNVMKYMEISDSKHPNRYDYLAMRGSESREQVKQKFESQPQASNPLRNTTTPGFGAAGGFGQPSSTFGRPALSTFGQPSTGQAASGFGQSSQPSAFGAATAFGKPAFGAPGFGQPTGFGQPAKSTFGQPEQPTSLFGQPPTTTSGFGQPSQPVSSFGQPSQPQSGFGQPAGAPAFGSAGFGQAAKQNPFAAPSVASGFGQAAQTGSGFGRPSFGQAASTTSPFGQQAQGTSAFGQPSSAAPASGFGKPSFGQSDQPASGSFGQASQSSSNPFSQPVQNKPSPFGQASQTSSTPFPKATESNSNPFGQATQVKPSPFGQASSAISSGNSSPFSNQGVAATSGFGAPSGTTAVSRPGDTAKPNPFASKTDAPSLLGKPAQPTTASTSVTQRSASSAGLTQAINTDLTTAIAALSAGGPHPLTNKPTAPIHVTETLDRQAPTFDQRSKQLTSFRGKRVQYIREQDDKKPAEDLRDLPYMEVGKAGGKGLERVWFPQGPVGQEIMLLSQPGQIGDLQGDEDGYTEEVLGMWRAVFETGRFDKGVPLVPPRREWCAWDF